MNRGMFWSGWTLFAGLMMALMGTFNALQGLAALFSDDYFVVSEDELLVFDFTVWGWITLLWGVLLVLTGIALLSGREWSRWAGLFIVMFNAVAQVAFLAAFPLWSILVIAVSIFVIFSLTVRWEVAQADLEGPA